MGSLDTAFGTLTSFGIEDLPKPIYSAIVDGFSDIEAKIEATVVGASEDKNKLSLFVLDLVYFELRVFPLEIVGVDESGLVPQKGGTLAKVFWEQALRLFFQNVALVFRDAIPEL